MKNANHTVHAHIFNHPHFFFNACLERIEARKRQTAPWHNRVASKCATGQVCYRTMEQTCRQ